MENIHYVYKHYVVKFAYSNYAFENYLLFDYFFILPFVNTVMLAVVVSLFVP